MAPKRTILITGGAGFIGSHVVRLFVTKYPDYRIVNLDKLTYAGNLANLRDIEDSPNYVFEKGDICDLDMLRALFGQYDIDGVIHLAAESHVDRSIRDPFTFARTNVMGTLSLLEAAREYWDGRVGGQIVLPHLHRRGVRGAGADPSRGRCCGRGERRRALRRGVLHRRDEVRAAQPLLGFESLVRPLRASLPRHVRDADAGDQLFEQLRALPIPGEAHPAVHQQYPPPKAAAGVRPRARTCATGCTWKTTRGPST